MTAGANQTPLPNSIARQRVELPPIGTASSATFLDRWGIIFVAYTGGWILFVGVAILAYYFWKQPSIPPMNGLSSEQIREALSIHKELHDQWTGSLTLVFDLLVTKTALPIVTLLLGYLFGRRKD